MALLKSLSMSSANVELPASPAPSVLPDPLASSAASSADPKSASREAEDNHGDASLSLPFQGGANDIRIRPRARRYRRAGNNGASFVFQAVALAPGHPLHLLLHCVHAHGKALEFHASAPCLRMVGSACTRRWGALAGWGIHPGANPLSALSSPKC